MLRSLLSILIIVICFSAIRGQVVAERTTRMPLPKAAVYDRRGKAVGISDIKGRLPSFAEDDYPITLSYLGFEDVKVEKPTRDTIFMQPTAEKLPEVVIATKSRKVLHILAYVREYSSLSTYTDTVFLFREKTVDFMLTPDRKTKFSGWTTPRTLACRSYYRFTNAGGLDSVSDESHHHFSWADWIGVAPVMKIPVKLKGADYATDTVKGRYSNIEIWTKEHDRVNVDIDVLADVSGRKWVPNLAGFFRDRLDFEKFKASVRYDRITGDSIAPICLTGFSFDIESRGRGHDIYLFNKVHEPIFVTTTADVYILDKEYITIKEAKKWAAYKFDTDDTYIFEPLDAPELNQSTLALIDRVNNIDKEGIRMETAPDERLISTSLNNDNFKIGRRALNLLKTLTGISSYKSKKNFNKRWSNFREECRRMNRKEQEKASPGQQQEDASKEDTISSE